MWRRGLLLGLGGLLVGAATAQEAPAPVAPDPAAPTPAPAPRPRRRWRAAPRPPQQDYTSTPNFNTPPAARRDAAPVPNRDLEAPNHYDRARPSLEPSVINRRLPRDGVASSGSINTREDRLFTPAPGARLNVPF